MKKTLAILIAIMMIFAFASCSGDSKESEESETEVTEAPAEEEEDTANEATEAPAEEATPEPVVEGTELSTEFWQIIYTDDWTYDEENDLWSGEGYYASLDIYILDGEEEEISVYIKATKEDTDNYRDYIKSAGIDAYEMVENSAVDFVNVGGVDCIAYEYEYWGETVLAYYGRSESAGVTVNVKITGDYSDTRATDLISTLTFTLEDTGNVDPPWPWNGEPFSTETPVSAMVGSYTITTEWISIDESVVVDDIFSGRVASAGDKAYILIDGVLKQYAYDGASFVYEGDIALDAEYAEITVSETELVFLSDFMEDFIVLNNGVMSYANSEPDYVAMHPSGEWGISWFSSSEVEKISLVDGVLQTETWNLEDINIISNVSVGEDHIFVSGSSIANGEQAIFVYDISGSLQLTLGDKDFGEPDSLGSITEVIETANGFVGIDGNMRTLCFWKSDGSFIGTLDDDELFGTYYPWISSACLLSDGSILIGMTEERADNSADEFIVFKISGF